MFIYPKDYETAKKEINDRITRLKKDGYTVFHKKYPVSDGLFIDMYTLRASKKLVNRVVLSAGLHGIEGYVGHVMMLQFLDSFLPKIIHNTEIILLHVLNPFGMKYFRRTNEHNVDLNRNFSQSSFSGFNAQFEKISSFFTPKKYKNKITANVGYYASLSKLIAKYGVSTLRESILLGQNIQQSGLYYSGNEFQKTSSIIFDLYPSLFSKASNVIWIDLHTGYGPRYQMSIVNSKYEIETTAHMKDKMDYPLILGLNKEDFYDIDGDMIEMLYHLHKKGKYKSRLYATCFEFGTLGETTRNTIESLKAMIFENSSYYEKQSQSFHDYAKLLIREQFLPSEEKWKTKALDDFTKAISEIFKFNNI